MLALGVAMFCVTVADAVFVQPFDGSVTVTVYVPGVVTAFVVPVPPPLHAYVTPAVVDDAVNVTLVTVQLSTAGAAILILGVVMFCVTVADVVMVQPFAGLVTVTVNVPGAETVFVVVVFPPPQSNVAPPVVEDAVNVTLVLVQVSTAGAAMLALGATADCVTVTEEVLVQAFDGSVTVTV